MYIGIIEDNIAVLEMLETTLTLYGHQVEKHSSVSSFFSALQKIQATLPYDLVITDLLLGRESGIEIVDLLSVARPVTLPMILMTAGSERLLTPVREKYPDLPIMRKPFKMQELIALIDKAKQRKPDDHRVEKGHVTEEYPLVDSLPPRARPWL